MNPRIQAEPWSYHLAWPPWKVLHLQLSLRILSKFEYVRPMRVRGLLSRASGVSFDKLYKTRDDHTCDLQIRIILILNCKVDYATVQFNLGEENALEVESPLPTSTSNLDSDNLSPEKVIFEDLTEFVFYCLPK